MRIINNRIIPTDIISKTLVGTSPAGESIDLIKIDQVDRFDSSGSVASFLRLLLDDGKEGVSDSFYFSLGEDMELRNAFLQTTENNMKLMEWEMALIQEQADLNHFITTISREYFQKELGYADFRII